MTKKNVGGRPTVMTPGVLAKLEDAFSWGCTDLEACCNANISKDALYDYCNKNPKFSERKEVLKNQPVMKSRRVIMGALADNDVDTAHKVISRKEGQKITQQNVELTHEQWLDTLD